QGFEYTAGHQHPLTTIRIGLISTAGLSIPPRAYAPPGSFGNGVDVLTGGKNFKLRMHAFSIQLRRRGCPLVLSLKHIASGYEARECCEMREDGENNENEIK